MLSLPLERFSGPLHRRLFLALSQQILSSDFHVALTLTRVLRPATKPVEGSKGGLSLTGVFRRSHYPVRSATFQDRDGNTLYLFAAV